APPEPAPVAAPHRVEERIMDLVVEKTGYPRDMLDLDLDLEADLGIDTVKQAEMFASIREMYNIPRDANVKLRDFSTLARVIGFVYDRRPDLKAPAARPAKPADPPPSPAPPPSPDAVQEQAPAVAAKTADSPRAPAPPPSLNAVQGQVLAIVA